MSLSTFPHLPLHHRRQHQPLKPLLVNTQRRNAKLAFVLPILDHQGIALQAEHACTRTNEVSTVLVGLEADQGGAQHSLEQFFSFREDAIDLGRGEREVQVESDRGWGGLMCGVMDGVMDGFMDLWMDLWIYVCIYVWIDGLMDAFMYGFMSGLMDLWIYVCMYVWMDSRLICHMRESV